MKGQRLLIRVLLLIGLLCVSSVSSEEQIKWTANDDAENALPLSMKQRQQLLKLHETIATSPDPQGTLAKVAEANQMSPQDLVNMMEKNRRDLDQNPGLAKPTTIVSVTAKLVSSLGIVLSQSAKKHPQSFALTVATLLFLLYATIVIPRTGMHVTRCTTVFSPRQTYLQKLVDMPHLEDARLGVQVSKTDWKDLMLEQDETVIHKLPRKSELAQAFSSRKTFTPKEIMEDFDLQWDEEDTEQLQDILELIFEGATDVVSSRQFTEFSLEKNPLRSVSTTERKKQGILLVPGLGMMGRYGLVHWRAVSESETEREATLTMTTLKGMGIFDGQIHMQIKKYKSKVDITVHLVVPKRGRKISKGMGKHVTTELTHSLFMSASKRAQQKLVRQSQGRQFKSGGNRRAKERRDIRSQREREIEEMSEDRRRKWQRKNPDAGRYRPSGHRMQSPNNC